MTTQQNSTNSVHYENIYESIDADLQVGNTNRPNNQIQQQPAPNPQQLNNQQNINLVVGNRLDNSANSNSNDVANRTNSNNLSYLNLPGPSSRPDVIHGRVYNYDVPKSRNFSINNERNIGYDSLRSKPSAINSRNLHLDLNKHRSLPRRPNFKIRQRSFDDTESYYTNSSFRLNDRTFTNPTQENIYEQIHEQPSASSSCPTRTVYGRLDIIGHGIGRIERHLSSSCGNIDHFSLGGHYAVLGHSHYGTIGHIRLGNCNNHSDSNPPNPPNVLNPNDSSQSMGNLFSSSQNGSNNAKGSNTLPKSTGTIPKARPNNPKLPPPPPPPPIASNHGEVLLHSNRDLNRISKASLNWLLVNKWLPLWVANTNGVSNEYKVIDFNFMFSRNCENCPARNNFNPNNGVVHRYDRIPYRGTNGRTGFNNLDFNERNEELHDRDDIYENSQNGAVASNSAMDFHFNTQSNGGRNMNSNFNQHNVTNGVDVQNSHENNVQNGHINTLAQNSDTPNRRNTNASSLYDGSIPNNAGINHQNGARPRDGNNDSSNVLEPKRDSNNKNSSSNGSNP